MIALPSGLQKWVDIIIAYAKEKMQIKTEKAEDQLRLRKGFIFMLRRLANRRRASEDPWEALNKSHKRGFNAVQDDLFHSL